MLKREPGQSPGQSPLLYCRQESKTIEEIREGALEVEAKSGELPQSIYGIFFG